MVDHLQELFCCSVGWWAPGEIRLDRSLTPVELDECAEITVLEGMLATCTTASHTFQAHFNKVMQERKRTGEMCTPQGKANGGDSGLAEDSM